MSAFTIDFNIGFIAPSRSGKTSLLYALCYQLENKLSQKEGYTFKAVGETQGKMKLALHEYKANFDIAKKNEQRLFEGKAIKPNQELVQYEFQLYKQAENAKISPLEINLKFNDYPGGLVNGDGDFTVRETADLQKSFNACDIMLIPIPADAVSAVIMNSGKTDDKAFRNRVNAGMALDTDSVVQSLAKWINCRNKKFGAIRFVAVKCEHVFHTGQGGVEDVSAQDIYDYIKINYYDRVLQLIPDANKDKLKFLHIEYCAVDTYGVAVYAGINDADTNAFSSIFKLMKNCPEDLQPLGCVDILVSALQFYFAEHKNILKKRLEELELTYAEVSINLIDFVSPVILCGKLIKKYGRYKDIKDCIALIVLVHQTFKDISDLSDLGVKNITDRYKVLQCPDWLEPDDKFDHWLEDQTRRMQ